MVRAPSRPDSPSEENLEEVADTVQRLVRTVAPHLRTQTKWGMPWLAGTDLVLLVGVFTRHVGVEFWRGSSLPDPHGLLEGTGKNLRHVKLRSVADARRAAFASLVREAVRLDARTERRSR